MLTVDKLAQAAVQQGSELLGNNVGPDRFIQTVIQVAWQDPLTLDGKGIFLIVQLDTLGKEQLSFFDRASAHNYTGVAIKMNLCTPETRSLLNSELNRLDLLILLLPLTWTTWDFQEWIYRIDPDLLTGSLLNPAKLVNSGFWVDEALAY